MKKMKLLLAAIIALIMHLQGVYESCTVKPMNHILVAKNLKQRLLKYLVYSEDSNLQPSTINHQLSTVNFQPSTLNVQP